MHEPLRPHDVEPFKHGGAEFERQHGGIQNHAPRDFEHDRVRVPHNQRMPNVVPAPEVNDQADDDERIAEQRGENRGAQNRTIAFETKHVHGRR